MLVTPMTNSICDKSCKIQQASASNTDEELQETIASTEEHAKLPRTKVSGTQEDKGSQGNQIAQKIIRIFH